MKISVNAPSYKRPNGILTPDYLPFVKIWVDHKEAEAYQKANPGVEIVACPEGVQGNLCRVRNYIMDQEFQNGADVVLIVDDDLHYIEKYEMVNGFGFERVKVETEDFLEFVEKYSLIAKEFGAKFWGLQCNGDALSYRHNTPFSTCSYIGGPFQCFLKGNRCRYDENLPLKEDYDMTLQQLNLERVAIRVNAYHYICEQSTNPGGCATYRNREREQQQFEALVKKWGSKIVKRDSGNDQKIEKERRFADYNPIIKIPIKGV